MVSCTDKMKSTKAGKKANKSPKSKNQVAEPDAADLRSQPVFESTITEHHYTSKGEHPEDRIYRDREYIHRLRAHLDEVYDALERDLRVKEGENWLFDFIYNEDRAIEFEDYLIECGIRYKDIVRQKK